MLRGTVGVNSAHDPFRSSSCSVVRVDAGLFRFPAKVIDL